jgi:hypothetical protein
VEGQQVNKAQAVAAVKAGAVIVYSRAAMGMRRKAWVGDNLTGSMQGNRLRADVALTIIRELDMRPDKAYGITKVYRLPKGLS